MEYRQLGRSGLRVSVLTLGTMTFGGAGGFSAVGATGVEGARRQVDLCLDAGVNLIDTADVYSGGLAEEITGAVIKGRRDSLLRSTKVRMSMVPTTRACPGSTSSLAARRACAGSAPTTSTSTTCTSGTGIPGLRRPCPR
jgi:aryl-alcohol dehydrogenase-like predicted oxidoreductase